MSDESKAPIPEDLKIGDLFPHRYRPALDDEGFAKGHLMPCDSGGWISTAHAFKVAKSLKERIDTLTKELADAWARVRDKDATIAAQAVQIAAYEQRVEAWKAIEQTAERLLREAREDNARLRETRTKAVSKKESE